MLRWWYEEDRPGRDLPDLSWRSLLSRWDAIETDFHHFYGCDLGDGVLRRRSWRWFRIRVIRLLTEDSMLSRALGLRRINTTP